MKQYLKLWSYCLVLMSSISLVATKAKANNVDVLILYDKAIASTMANEPQVQAENWISSVNDIFLNSGVNINLNLMATAAHKNYSIHPVSILASITDDPEVSFLRDFYKADFVIKFSHLRYAELALSGKYGYFQDVLAVWQKREIPGGYGYIEDLKILGQAILQKVTVSQGCYIKAFSAKNYTVVADDCDNYKITYHGFCGLAWQSVSSDRAFSTVDPGCSYQTMAHELGHNFGLAHDRYNDLSAGSVFEYGRGHGIDNVFRTIMAYRQSFNAYRINYFSNPSKICKDNPCGVPTGESGEANAVDAINQYVDQFVAHR